VPSGIEVQVTAQTTVAAQRPVRSGWLLFGEQDGVGRQPPGRSAVEYMRRAVSCWPLWELPRWLQATVTGVVAFYCCAIAAALAHTSFRAGQMYLFVALVMCSAIAIELTRRMGEPGRVARDVYAIWDLPAAVLLPPLYALLVPIPRMIITQLRIRRGLVYRRAYTAAAVGLAYAAASVAFHAVSPVLGPGAGTGTGGPAMLWTLLAVGCGLLRLVVNYGLVLTAVKGAAPETPLRPEIIGAEALYENVTELSLGTLSAFAAVHSVLTILYAVPLVISLQRSLRHAQLVGETRVDGKTGLLNDNAWRRLAADEIARAARTRAPVAVGILDIDHFKEVNEAYGHLAGDAVLSGVAAATRALLREHDVIGRVGGEEFAFILPDTPTAEAVEVAERLREKIPRLAFPHAGTASPMPARVTVSIGVAAADRADWDLNRYYRLADQALYAAKENGRDAVRVVRADPAAVASASRYCRTWAAWARLRPLWALLVEAAPDVKLSTPPGTRFSARYHLHRRVIEIRDAELALRPFWDSRAVREAADAACRAGLSQDERDAAIEAVMIVTALDARRRGAEVQGGEEAGGILSEPHNDLESETARLLLVCRAVTHSPIVLQAAAPRNRPAATRTSRECRLIRRRRAGLQAARAHYRPRQACTPVWRGGAVARAEGCGSLTWITRSAPAS
jgi:diguanylate cyclase (GGDEF)-like protein